MQISITHEEAISSPVQPKQQKETTVEKDRGKSGTKPKSKSNNLYQLCKRRDCSFGIDPPNAFRYPMDNSWNPDLPVTVCVKCADFRLYANCLQYAYKLTCSPFRLIATTSTLYRETVIELEGIFKIMQ